MATEPGFVDYVLEQAGLGERLTYRKMFGEYALYLDGKVVAMACDNSLFAKPLPQTAARVAGLPERPPYPGGKPHPVVDELLDDGERLQALLLATADALPVAPPKAAKAPRGRRTRA